MRIEILVAGLFLTTTAFAQDHHQHGDDHQHDHGGGAQDHASHNTAPADDGAHRLFRTAEIDMALEAGGTPIVVEVLGVVCDFCAKAMNRTFGKRPEVAAVYVDLDTKTLNLVLFAGASLDDTDIEKLVERSGYKTKALHRGANLIENIDAPDPT